MMNRILHVAIFFLFTCAAFAETCGQMPVGFHEFAIVGANNRVFVSHYPMFSSVHAYQVLMEVELSSEDHDAQQKFLTQMVAHPEIEYTYSPYRRVAPTANRVADQDDWVLPEKARVSSMINGDIHYSQNSQDISFDQNVVAKVIRVFENRLMLPGETRPQSLTYIYFGGFLAHLISAPPNPGEQKPDFDQIVTLSGAPNLVEGGRYSIDGRANEIASKLTVGQSIMLGGSEVKVASEIFTHKVMTDR
jgi:hypothetical protein